MFILYALIYFSVSHSEVTDSDEQNIRVIINIYF